MKIVEGGKKGGLVTENLTLIRMDKKPVLKMLREAI